MKIGALAPAVAWFLDEMSHSIRIAILHNFFSITLCDNSSESFFLPHINTFLLLLNCEFDGNVVKHRIQLLSLCVTYVWPSVKCSMFNAICVYWSLWSINNKESKNVILSFFIWWHLICSINSGKSVVMTTVVCFASKLVCDIFSIDLQNYLKCHLYTPVHKNKIPW